MKRDMDLIRQIMLEIEGGKAEFEPGDQEALVMMEDGQRAKAMAEKETFLHHLQLIEDAGYVDFIWHMDGSSSVRFVSNAGHDFIDGVRNPAIWKKTKDGASKAGGFTLDLIGALAKGFLKKQIEDRTGVAIDL